MGTKVMTPKEAVAPIKNPKTGEPVIDDKTGQPKTALSVAKGVMTEESWAKADAAANGGDAAAKVTLVLPQKSKLKTKAGELRSMLFNYPGHRYNAFDQFSMVLALVLGTAGLPHILNRYYTNPSGAAARRSTFWVLVFIGTFYIMAPIVGAAGRYLIPKALEAGIATGNAPLIDGLLVKSDQVVPATAQLLGGDILMGIAVAGAFAAMFSTIGGLLIASASAIGHDVYEKYVNPDATEAKRVFVGKMSVLAVAAISLVVGLGIPSLGLDKAYPSLIAMMVTWAFSVGASAFVPMLLTGIWWKKTTERGAISGMLVGMLGAISIILMNVFQQLKTAEGAFAFPVLQPVTGNAFLSFFASLTFPVLFTFPAGLLTIIIVSMIDGKLPKNVDEIWLRIHGTAHERHEKQHGLDKVGSLLGAKK
ncbi:MAG: hypothetical protein C0418_03820 [Coriobacteriaceae bacterium]|nr:hypothetical protein [Coriobacteriaceae bacterium]